MIHTARIPETHGCAGVRENTPILIEAYATCGLICIGATSCSHETHWTSHMFLFDALTTGVSIAGRQVLDSKAYCLGNGMA